MPSILPPKKYENKGHPLGVKNALPPAICVVNKNDLSVKFVDLFTFAQTIAALQKMNGLELFIVEPHAHYVPPPDPDSDDLDEYPVNNGILDYWNDSDDFGSDEEYAVQ